MIQFTCLFTERITLTTLNKTFFLLHSFLEHFNSYLVEMLNVKTATPNILY